jgi:hypothetical protein
MRHSLDASDALSGLDGIYCNGQQAILDGGSFTCTVPLAKGYNVIIVNAQDLAGHGTSVAATVTRSVAPGALSIQPAQLTLLAGDLRPIQVVDDLGQLVTTGLTWSTSDDTIAEVDTTDGFAVAAHALGSATLTVTAGSLTADLAV